MKIYGLLIFFFLVNSVVFCQYVYRLPEPSTSNYTHKQRTYKAGKSAPKFFKDDPFVQCITLYEKPKQKKTNDSRLGYSFQYGPETIITIFSPVKFSLDLFPIKTTIFLGADFSANAFEGIWGSIGGHIGYQRKFLLFQFDGDITYVEAGSISGQQLSFNPKIGFVYYGFFFKTGPNFVLSHTFEEHLTDVFSFVEISNLPINFEIGYYFKLSY